MYIAAMLLLYSTKTPTSVHTVATGEVGCHSETTLHSFLPLSLSLSPPYVNHIFLLKKITPIFPKLSIEANGII